MQTPRFNKTPTKKLLEFIAIGELKLGPYCHCFWDNILSCEIKQYSIMFTN